MNFLQIEPTSIHLKGISRTAHFTLHNRNPFLATSFNLHFADHSINSHPTLSIFPSKGVLLKGQSRKIRFCSHLELIKQFGSFFIGNNSELYIQDRIQQTAYGKHLSMKIKDQLQGWDQIPKEESDMIVEVQVGGQKQAIQHYIKQEIMFNQQFAKEDVNLSAIQQSKNKSFISQASLNDLQIQSIPEELPIHSVSGEIQVNQRKNQSSIIDYPFQDICPLQYGQSKASGFKCQKKKQQSKINYKLVESQIVEGHKQVQCSMKTVGNNNFSQDFMKSKINQSSSKRNMQLIILAIVAAFFVALGNNMGRIAG